MTAVPVIHGSEAVVKMAMRLPGSRREEEVAFRRLAASLWRGPSPGWRSPRGGGEEEEEEGASSFEGAEGGEAEEEKEKGQGPLFFCCPALPELAAAEAPDAEEAEAEAEEEPLSPLSALAAACSGAGRSARILSPSTLLIISVIVDEVGHAKLVSVAVFDAAAACWTCDAASWAERASAAPSCDQFPATVSAVSSRVKAAAFAARCREAWAVLRAASNSRAFGLDWNWLVGSV